MKSLRQGAYLNEVRRIDDKIGISTASLVATHMECSASITFELDTFEIRDASWAIHRAPDMERRGQGTLEMLIGESAFIEDRNSIRIMPDYSKSTDYSLPPGGWDVTDLPEHKSVLEEKITDKEDAKARKNDVSPEWKIIRELCMENIRGIYQAEFYLLPERGYATLAEYERCWIDSKNDYCRPYNEPKPEIQDWPLHTGAPQHYRNVNLYNKYKQFMIIDNEDGTITAHGTYNDSAHEFYAVLEYGKEDGIITKFEETAVRVPYRACQELDHLYDEMFIGQNIKTFAKRDIGKICGGGMGCFHLVDIIADIADMVKEV